MNERTNDMSIADTTYATHTQTHTQTHTDRHSTTVPVPTHNARIRVIRLIRPLVTVGILRRYDSATAAFVVAATRTSVYYLIHFTADVFQQL